MADLIHKIRDLETALKLSLDTSERLKQELHCYINSLKQEAFLRQNAESQLAKIRSAVAEAKEVPNWLSSILD
jgi:hypothetical protein